MRVENFSKGGEELADGVDIQEGGNRDECDGPEDGQQQDEGGDGP